MSLEGDGDHLSRQPAGDRPAKTRTACHEECGRPLRGLRRKRLGGSNCLPAGKDPWQSPDALSLRPTCPPQKVAWRGETMLRSSSSNRHRGWRSLGYLEQSLAANETLFARARLPWLYRAFAKALHAEGRPKQIGVCARGGKQRRPRTCHRPDGTFWTLRQLRSLAATQGMARTARLRRVSSSERPTSMPRHASSITTTANPSRFASSAV